MEKSEIYQALEDDFTSTFIRELLPGVLHNFANPLNGIMGRSKLLQRRIDDAVKKITDKYPEAAVDLQEELQRIKNDIGSINKESESFFEMFRDASGKFYTLAAKGDERINLSELLAAEMRFSNFYLEFKHEITKNIEFDGEIPDIKGNIAELSLAFWRLIRFAMTMALKSQKKEFFLKTQHNKENILILIRYSGNSVTNEDAKKIIQYLQKDSTDVAISTLEKGFLLAIMILRKYSVQMHFTTQDDINTISVSIPYGSSGS